MSQQTVKVVAHLKAVEGKVDELKDVLTAAIPATRKEDGCIAYDLFQNAANSAELTFIEEWKDNDCLNAHLNSPDFSKLAEKLGGLLAAAPDIRVYSKLM